MLMEASSVRKQRRRAKLLVRQRAEELSACESHISLREELRCQKLCIILTVGLLRILLLEVLRLLCNQILLKLSHHIKWQRLLALTALLKIWGVAWTRKVVK